ncbi:hypothetical protein C8R21_14114 [Nitrosospira multiformis]|uniref:Uncharacterized protein n=1 Tax=Nitrosospira multiformis TaxID=1231 RepID=A0A2T5I4D1_9PROT|nr:hypothetical protein C8R21_14114 [Nitrosospira multiformis]
MTNKTRSIKQCTISLQGSRWFEAGGNYTRLSSLTNRGPCRFCHSPKAVLSRESRARGCTYSVLRFSQACSRQFRYPTGISIPSSKVFPEPCWFCQINHWQRHSISVLHASLANAQALRKHSCTFGELLCRSLGNQHIRQFVASTPTILPTPPLTILYLSPIVDSVLRHKIARFVVIAKRVECRTHG